jgi:hypothetical protein
LIAAEVVNSLTQVLDKAIEFIKDSHSAATKLLRQSKKNKKGLYVKQPAFDIIGIVVAKLNKFFMHVRLRLCFFFRDRLKKDILRILLCDGPCRWAEAIGAFLAVSHAQKVREIFQVPPHIGRTRGRSVASPLKLQKPELLECHV